MRFVKKLAAASVTTAVAAMMFASVAPASSHNPTGEFAQFAECPLNNELVENCVYSVTDGGSFTAGTRTVPLKNPVTLQGGFFGEGQEVTFVGAENGVTLSKTPQPVPGGLLGIVAPEWWPEWLQEWFNEFINNGITGVTATVEIAGPASGIFLSTENLLNQEGTALGLPAKIKLDNAILGSNCYIGSDEAPVQIDFTSGKSGELEGSVGEITFNETFTLITISGGALVNGTFAAPAAEGCGGIFSFIVDPLVNAILGLPDAEGNSAILEGVLQSANANAVRASE
ncbi:MAG TPA: hypothetical protein VFX97_20490 [Pyrinomonadaceae bacterium]|nr:hypothetical protein [Pyrinomonadaceae bacterium]